MIAACVPTFVLSDIPSCMQGLSDVITREGFQLLLGSSSFSAEQEAAMNGEDTDPVARLRRLIEERQSESIEILRSWMEHDEEPA